ncbi:MAG: C39 family peptidase, partial [Clostridium sp.]
RKKDGTPGYLKNSTGVLFDKLPILIAGINYTSATESKYLGASEVLSTFEMLKFYGITPELTDIINNIDTDTRTVDSNDSSPDNVFIGNMKKTRKEGTYGASAKYMKSVISKILKNNRTNIQLEYKKNLTLEEVKDSINNNTPIMLWMNDPLLEKRIVNTFNMNKNTIVIKGYNDNYIIVDDPLTSSNRKINIEEFKKILENSNIETITFKK